MVMRPRLPSKGLTLRWQQSHWSGLSLVRPLDGNVLISALPGTKTMFLIVSRAVQLTFSLMHIIYISFFHFFSHFKVNYCRGKLHTDSYQSVFNVKI